MDTVLGALGNAIGVGPLQILGRPESGGWSNETVIVFDGTGTRYVVRTVPQQDSMFDNHDLGFQRDCMVHARAHGLRTPRVILSDLAGGVLGVSGFVMEYVAGRVPNDTQPTFATAGFLHDASAAQQGRFHSDLVSVIGHLHRIPVPDFPIRRAKPVDELDHINGSRATDRGDRGRDILADAYTELKGTAPVGAHDPVFVWGDARPANTIVADDFTVSTMLDWELAFVGQGEHDVAWLLEMNRMRAPEQNSGRPLPGFASDDQTWLQWEAEVGRLAVAPEWFTKLAAFRIAVFLECNLRAAVRKGDLPPEHELLGDNRALRRVAELLG